jgi:hypothetical protein
MRSHRWLLMSLISVGLVACSGSGKDPDQTAGDDDDTVGDDDDSSTVLSGPESVIGLPNIDNVDDWGAENPDDNDIVSFVITPSSTAADTLFLDIQDALGVRIWLDGSILVSKEQDVEIPWQAEPLELKVEYRDFNTQGRLVIEERDADGNALQSITVQLISSPLLLNNHLQPAEFVVATNFPFAGYSNGAFIAGYEAVLGDRFEAADGNRYPDPWMQDEIEFAYGTLPTGEVMDLVLDSIRDRELDDYPEDRWRGEQFGVTTFGRGYASSQDSFGNLEVSPPVDGYPFGRIYYGSESYYTPQATALYDLLEAVQLQDPFTIDISWLCVGHVDEFMTFVPDSTAPRGFRFVINDVQAAYDVLDALDPDTPLPRYAGRQNHNYATVGELVSDNGLRLHNEDLQLDYVTPIREQMIAELGLLPEEVVLLPGLFEEIGYCYGTNAALMPGMANLIVTDFGEGTQLFMADPFIRTDLGDQSSDPMIAAVTAVLPAEAELHFLDDWEVYHLGLGEVHCGSNVIRTPPTTPWWTLATGDSQ